MSQYKVGDVAALFAKPKEPTSGAAKKLQSLFEEFHCKKNKSGFQSKESTMLNRNPKNTENGDGVNNRSLKKNKKRKFSDISVTGSTLSNENNIGNEHKKIIKQNLKGIEGNIEINFPRKKKKKLDSFECNDSEQANNKTKAFNKKSGFIKKSKQNRNKGDSASFNKTNSKNANVINNDEVSEDDEAFKNEIRQLIKNNSETEQLGKKNKFVTNQVSPKKFSNFKKKTKLQLESNTGLEDNNMQTSKVDIDFKASVNERNKVVDFVRRPKIKNEAKISSRYYDKNDSLNVVEASEQGENHISHKKSGNKFNGIQNSELDFIPLSDSKKDDEDTLNRTVFVGNLPLNVSKKALNACFSPFGEIANIRSIGIETDKVKIFGKNSPKSLNPNYASDSMPAFVEFVERQSAIDALSLTGTVFKGRHITVDIAVAPGSRKCYDGKRSIFIGNLPFGIKDESIWNAFSECGRIEGVRLIRDRETGIGKGFGYVLFSTVESKENALKLNDLQIEGRSVRVKAVESKKEKQKAEETSNKKDTFKSRAIRCKKRNKNPNSRKSVTKIIKREKSKHNKKKIAAILQKSMK